MHWSKESSLVRKKKLSAIEVILKVRRMVYCKRLSDKDRRRRRRKKTLCPNPTGAEETFRKPNSEEERNIRQIFLLVPEFMLVRFQRQNNLCILSSSSAVVVVVVVAQPDLRKFLEPPPRQTSWCDLYGKKVFSPTLWSNATMMVHATESRCLGAQNKKFAISNYQDSLDAAGRKKWRDENFCRRYAPAKLGDVGQGQQPAGLSVGLSKEIIEEPFWTRMVFEVKFSFFTCLPTDSTAVNPAEKVFPLLIKKLVVWFNLDDE